MFAIAQTKKGCCRLWWKVNLYRYKVWSLIFWSKYCNIWYFLQLKKSTHNILCVKLQSSHFSLQPTFSRSLVCFLCTLSKMGFQCKQGLCVKLQGLSTHVGTFPKYHLMPYYTDPGSHYVCGIFRNTFKNWTSLTKKTRFGLHKYSQFVWGFVNSDVL